MVCFEIVVSIPFNGKKTVNVLNEKCMEHLRKCYNADIIKEKDGLYKILACNEDAVGFLQDLPRPIVCIRVSLLHQKILLYSNYSLTKERCIPPRDLLLKQVYWAASQLERHLQTDPIPSRM
jgi:hypothetical protein